MSPFSGTELRETGFSPSSPGPETRQRELGQKPTSQAQQRNVRVYRYSGASDCRISLAVIEPKRLWHLGGIRAKHLCGPFRTWQTAGGKGL